MRRFVPNRKDVRLWFWKGLMLEREKGRKKRGREKGDSTGSDLLLFECPLFDSLAE